MTLVVSTVAILKGICSVDGKLKPTTSALQRLRSVYLVATDFMSSTVLLSWSLPKENSGSCPASSWARLYCYLAGNLPKESSGSCPTSNNRTTVMWWNKCTYVQFHFMCSFIVFSFILFRVYIFRVSFIRSCSVSRFSRSLKGVTPKYLEWRHGAAHGSSNFGYPQLMAPTSPPLPL